MNLMKTLVLLFTVFTLSNCDEDGAIQTVIKTNTATTLSVTGLEGQTSYTISDSADISELLESTSNFLEAHIKSLALRSEASSGTSIDGTITVQVGGNVLFSSQTVNLTSTDSVIQVPASASDIVSLINSGSFSISLTGTTSAPIEDNDFKLVVTPAITGTFEI